MSKEDRKAILDDAIECVTKDRNATHGEAEDNFATIAEYWSHPHFVKVRATSIAFWHELAAGGL